LPRKQQPPTASRRPPRKLPSPAVVHRRVRSDHASEKAEDYVEAIAEQIAAGGQCRNADLARKFGVSHVTTLRIIDRLVAAGLVQTRPYGPLELTPRGRRLASRCAERHQLVVEFLLALGVPRAIAEVDAEGIEHHVSPETLERLAAFVQQQASTLQ
jgi:DtxR family manganese transport transcriptional regulator